MIALVCPTCGYFIGSKANEYNIKKKEICDKNLSEEKEQEELTKLINSLKFRRYCCKMRVMTYKLMVNEVLPVDS